MKTVLVVEDIELNSDLLAQILEDSYNVLLARDGAEGVRLADERKPDMILMDISLPVIDGYEATRQIRAASPEVPIIGLSAHAMAGDAEKALRAGCTDYMTKPVDEGLLLEKLKQCLGE
jgi:two-component system, cell cycle response regulator DivK